MLLVLRFFQKFAIAGLVAVSPLLIWIAEPIDYQALTAEFERIGISRLKNGLDANENARLFTTTLLPETIALVLRGPRSARNARAFVTDHRLVVP